MSASSRPPLNCRGDRLTETLIYFGQSRRLARKRVRSTQSPIRTIMPLSSASGMKSAGDIGPRVGWFQRNSASKETISLPLEIDDRLIVQLEFFAGDARRACRARAARRSCIFASMSGSKKRNPSRPSSLGAIHRQIRVPQQIARLRAVARSDRDADADADFGALPFEIVGLADALDDALGDASEIDILPSRPGSRIRRRRGARSGRPGAGIARRRWPTWLAAIRRRAHGRACR